MDPSTHLFDRSLAWSASPTLGGSVTRNHYLHEFFPHSTPYYRCDLDGEDAKVSPQTVDPTVDQG